jgi:hypothetical protein
VLPLQFHQHLRTIDFRTTGPTVPEQGSVLGRLAGGIPTWYATYALGMTMGLWIAGGFVAWLGLGGMFVLTAGLMMLTAIIGFACCPDSKWQEPTFGTAIHKWGRRQACPSATGAKRASRSVEFRQRDATTQG